MTVYPNHVFEDEVRKRGKNMQVLWELRGPKDTHIRWIVAYVLNGRLVLHMTTGREGKTWNVLTGIDDGRIDETVRDVLVRCGLKAD